MGVKQRFVTPPRRAAAWLLAVTVVGAPHFAAAGGATPTILPLVLQGDSVPGVGLVTTISNLAVNDAGEWLVEADTDNADTDADAVLLRNGTLALREGDAIPGPAGILLDSFDSVTLNNAGQSGFNFGLDGTSGGTSDDSSVHAYLDTTAAPATGTLLVAQEGDDAPGLSMGTPLIGFFDVKINNAAQLLVTASVDDPNITSSVDRALYIWTSDAASGGLSTSTLIAAEGDVLTGQSAALTDFGTGAEETAINDDGDVLFAVDIPGGLDAIYLYDGTFTEVAQEGDPSPVAGRNWDVLTSTALDLNNNGDAVYRGSLDGDTATDSVIIKKSLKLIQEGDTLPAIGGVFTFTSFGTGPVQLSDGDEVLWYGDWNDSDTDIDTGLFVEDELLVQEGVTTVGALGIIDTLRGIGDGYRMSPNGRYVIFEAILDDGTDGAFLLDRGTIFTDGFESGDTTAWSATVP